MQRACNRPSLARQAWDRAAATLVMLLIPSSMPFGHEPHNPRQLVTVPTPVEAQ